MRIFHTQYFMLLSCSQSKDETLAIKSVVEKETETLFNWKLETKNKTIV